MRFLELVFIWFIGWLAVPFSGLAQSPHGMLRQGDQAYLGSNYEDAETAYREALQVDPGNEKAQFNLGNAQYRQGNYQDAAKAFGAATQVAAAPDRADAFHNLGNANLQQEKYQEAVAAYQNSLRWRPGDAETKRNLQIAKERLKEQEQRKQEQQQEQQQQEEQQRQPNSGRNGQDGSEKEQEQPAEPAGSQLPASKKQFLESIGREDQRNKRKYQEFNNSIKPRTRTKDW